MKIRCLEPEIMDLGPEHYTKEEYNECLDNLGLIGKYLGNNKMMIKTFKKLPYSFDSILDIGCGGGLFTLQLAKSFKHAQVKGIDICPDAINYAKNLQQNTSLQPNNLTFELRNLNELNEEKFDIITTSLVLHHLSDDQIISFLKHASTIAKKAIVINDLNRHWLSYYGCSVIIPLFTKNRLTRIDSLLSIKKSFVLKDLKYYLESAGFSSQNYKITWHWPFYWIIKIEII